MRFSMAKIIFNENGCIGLSSADSWEDLKWKPRRKVEMESGK
jgi:hypothetical protein